MGIQNTFVISMAMLMGLAYASEGPYTQEVCLNEVFQIRCQPDEVIDILSAKLGRMSVGRCVRRNYGYLGCYTDVHRVVDMQCSGYRTCQVTVDLPVPQGSEPKACHPDLTQYLQFTYSCIEEATVRDWSTTEYPATGTNDDGSDTWPTGSTWHSESGSNDPTGITIVTGYAEPRSERGPKGEQGPTGEQRPTGEQGPTGEQRPTGEQGPTGEERPAGWNADDDRLANAGQQQNCLDIMSKSSKIVGMIIMVLVISLCIFGFAYLWLQVRLLKEHVRMLTNQSQQRVAKC